MRAIKRLFLGLALLTLVLGAVAFALPRHLTVERSAVINAPESDIFPYLNAPRKFNEWSPWAARDPQTHYAFSGPADGEGARMEWDSDHPEVGKGALEIVESRENRSVTMALNFGPDGLATAQYDLTPAGAGTRVTWGLNTDVGNNPVSRWMGLMLDRWVGEAYEEGLSRLKKLVEDEGGGR